MHARAGNRWPGDGTSARIAKDDSPVLAEPRGRARTRRDEIARTSPPIGATCVPEQLAYRSNLRTGATCVPEQLAYGASRWAMTEQYGRMRMPTGIALADPTRVKGWGNEAIDSDFVAGSRRLLD